MTTLWPMCTNQTGRAVGISKWLTREVHFIGLPDLKLCCQAIFTLSRCLGCLWASDAHRICCLNHFQLPSTSAALVTSAAYNQSTDAGYRFVCLDLAFRFLECFGCNND